MRLVTTHAAGAALALLPLAAAAHHAEGYATPVTPLAGLLSGLAHPAIELGQFAFLVALGVLAARAPRGHGTIGRFVAGSAIGAGLAALGVTGPAEPLLPLLLLAIAALLARAGDGRAARTVTWPGAAALLVAGLVHGQAAIEPIAGAAGGAFATYVAGMLATQCAIVVVARAVAARGATASAFAGRTGRGVSATAAALAALAVALHPGLSLF
ncbi:MAG: hypothetical protein RJA99_301 [Pseudomonadota bacterium]|jgi:urease accessory protein